MSIVTDYYLQIIPLDHPLSEAPLSDTSGVYKHINSMGVPAKTSKIFITKYYSDYTGQEYPVFIWNECHHYSGKPYSTRFIPFTMDYNRYGLAECENVYNILRAASTTGGSGARFIRVQGFTSQTLKAELGLDARHEVEPPNGLVLASLTQAASSTSTGVKHWILRMAAAGKAYRMETSGAIWPYNKSLSKSAFYLSSTGVQTPNPAYPYARPAVANVGFTCKAPTDTIKSQNDPVASISGSKDLWYRYSFWTSVYQDATNRIGYLRVNFPIPGLDPKAGTIEYRFTQPLSQTPNEIFTILYDTNAFHRFWGMTLNFDAQTLTSLSTNILNPIPNTTQSTQMRQHIGKHIHAVNLNADDGLFIVLGSEAVGYGLDSGKTPLLGVYRVDPANHMGLNPSKPGKLIDVHLEAYNTKITVVKMSDVGVNGTMSAAPSTFYLTSGSDFRYYGSGSKQPTARAMTEQSIDTFNDNIAAFPTKHFTNNTELDLYIPHSQLGTHTDGATIYYLLEGFFNAVSANNNALKYILYDMEYVEVKTSTDLSYRLNLPRTLCILLYDSNGGDRLSSTDTLSTQCAYYHPLDNAVANVNKVVRQLFTLGTRWKPFRPPLYDPLYYNNKLLGGPWTAMSIPHKYRLAGDMITNTYDERNFYVPTNDSVTWYQAVSSPTMSKGVTAIGKNNTTMGTTYLLHPNTIMSANRELTPYRWVKMKFYASSSEDELFLFKIHRNASGWSEIPMFSVIIENSTGTKQTVDLDPYPAIDDHTWLYTQTYGFTLAIYIKKNSSDTYDVQFAWYTSALLGGWAKDPRTHPDFGDAPSLSNIRKTVTISGLNTSGYFTFFMNNMYITDYKNQNHEVAVTPIGKRYITPAVGTIQPICTNDTSTTTAGNNVTKDVLANDTNAAKIIAVTYGTSGEEADIVNNTTLSYTPSAGFSGNAVFTYTAENAAADATCTGTWTVTVTAVAGATPICTNDTAIATSGVQKSIYVISNDTNVDSLSGIITPPSNGTASYTPSGTIYYTSFTGYVGTDIIDYEGINAEGDSTCTGRLTINVASAGYAASDSYTVDKNTPTSLPVILNDSGGSTVSQSVSPLHGSVVYDGTGSVLYTPYTDYIGFDSFNYSLLDSSGNEVDTAYVAINVVSTLPLPVANNDTFSVTSNAATPLNVLANDSGYDGNPTVTINPLHGSVVVSTTGEITYTSTTNYVGSDSFTYKIANADGFTDTATVTITVGAGDTTVSLSPDTFNTTMNTAIMCDVLANDDSDAVLVSTTNGQHGSAVLTNSSSGDQVWYTPDNGYYGTDTFTYTARDVWLNQSTTTVTINIADTEIILANDTVTVAENSSVVIDVTANDDPLTVVDAITTLPSNGTAVISGNNITYTPTTDYFGTDSFQYRGKDPSGNTATATVSVTVTEVGDPIGPGLYKVNTSPSIVMKRKEPSSRWSVIGSGTTDNELEIYLPATIAWNNTIMEGTTRCVINGITSSDIWIAPGTMRELDFVYVRYTDDTSPPVSMSSNRHGLVLVFTDGKLTGGHYWVNYGNGNTAHPLYIPTYAGANGVDSGTGRITLPKQSISNWGKDYSPWDNTGEQKCSRGTIRHILNNLLVYPTVPEEDIWIIDFNNSTYSCVYVSLSRYFEAADPAKKTIVGFNFTNANNQLNTRLKKEVLWYDKPVTPSVDFPKYDLDDWLCIERRGEDSIRLWVNENGIWKSSGDSYGALWVNNPYTTDTLAAMPRCPSHLWDTVTSWEIRHINTSPPSVVDPAAGPVIFVRHYSQFRKVIYIPRAFAVHDITDRAYTKWEFTLEATGMLATLESRSLICRAFAINYSPASDDASIIQPPQKSVTLFFNNGVQDGDWDFGTKFTTSIPTSNTMLVTQQAWTLDTSVVLSGDLDLSPHGIQANYPYADWINQSIPLTYSTNILAPTAGVIARRNIIYCWTDQAYLWVLIPTCHTFGKNDRHVDIFRITLPTTVLNLLDVTEDICVWDDLDTFQDLIDSLPEYIDDTIVIARRHLIDGQMYHVKPRVGSNPPETESFEIKWCGYAFNGNYPDDTNFGWDYSDCNVYNLDMLYFGGKRIVTTIATLSAFTDSNRVVYEYTKGGELRITLAKMWLTGHVPDEASVELYFEVSDRWDSRLVNVDKLIIDPRGVLDISTNSDLYKTPMLFDNGDIELVLARDSSTSSPTYTLHIVERIGDGSTVSYSFLAEAIASRTFNTFEKIESIPADNYIYPRTDSDFGGLITESRVEGDTISWVDTTYFQKVPVNNPDVLRIDFVTPILSTLDDFARRRVYIEVPLSDISSEIDDMVLRPYTCFTNQYKPDVINGELPIDAIHGSTVISKITMWSVRLHTFITDTWYHIGDYRVYVDDTVPLDSTLFSKPSCTLFITEQECIMGFTPADRDTYVSLPGTWDILGGVTRNANEYLITNRLGGLDDNPPIMSNIYREFALPVAMLADTIELTFKRKPVGSVGYITSARVDSANAFFVFLTNAPMSEVDFSDMVPTVPANREIYTILLPLRDVPSPIFHDTDASILDMELIQQLPTMTFRTTDLNTAVDGTHDVRLVAVKSGSRCGFWLYESGQLIARTTNSVDIPWIKSGTIGIHEHSLVPGIVNDRVIDLEVGYNRSEFDCLVKGSLEPNFGCEPAPSTSEQSIHTVIVDNNVPYMVYTPLPGTIYGYVHIDIVNTGETPARVNLFRGNIDESDMILYKSLKPMTKDELVEIHNIRVIPGHALFIESVSGSISVRCSSIEDKY